MLLTDYFQVIFGPQPYDLHFVILRTIFTGQYPFHPTPHG